MRQKTINLMISIIVFIGCIVVNYIITDIGFNMEFMALSGVPLWLGSLIICIILPLCTYFYLQYKCDKRNFDKK